MKGDGEASGRWDEHMGHAARIALRGHGGAEPNPMVGCVIVGPDGRTIAEGHHRRCGGPHAEIEALRRAGDRARGATAVVTLEPCNHHGRTGPCSQALARAGVARVVYACADPNPAAAGGAATLREGGIEVLHAPHPAAERATAPFLARVRHRRPWTVAKWAESSDGRIATRAGEPRWISGERSRAMVHRERARCDAVLTGMGTVLRDDPLLTVRGTRAGRTPLRVVWDPRLGLPVGSALVRTAHQSPLLCACTPKALESRADHAQALRTAGVEVAAFDDVAALSRALLARGTSTLLVEAGPGLVRPMIDAGLVDLAWVFTAPHALGDVGANGDAPVARDRLERLPCWWRGMRGPDRVALYRVPT
jgi:diaminohydroxyphosphoribosylaminopyrimidine deaminase/5-amino-6-(5-phosphoribosylamino)uracil reductase